MSILKYSQPLLSFVSALCLCIFLPCKDEFFLFFFMHTVSFDGSCSRTWSLAIRSGKCHVASVAGRQSPSPTISLSPIVSGMPVQPVPVFASRIANFLIPNIPPAKDRAWGDDPIALPMLILTNIVGGRVGVVSTRGESVTMTSDYTPNIIVKGVYINFSVLLLTHSLLVNQKKLHATFFIVSRFHLESSIP
jgi:hypothetical protein